MTPEWKPSSLRDFDDVSRMELIKHLKSLDERDTIDGAEFVMALEVGDEAGVWSRVMNNDLIGGVVDPVTVIEGVRVGVFWEL